MTARRIAGVTPARSTGGGALRRKPSRGTGDPSGRRAGEPGPVDVGAPGAYGPDVGVAAEWGLPPAG
ncbi:MAG TPA: hypothetical protein VMV41_02635 [Cellulomonadaceae bacterium]|nr:hypothetical protein [Cellulomonadaceae bacterium]